MSYDRYKKLKVNGEVKDMPFIKIPVRPTDYYTVYTAGRTRMDLLSYKYYDDPNYGWLIMQANPGYGGVEYKIPDNTVIRIPYPLTTVLTQLGADMDRYDELYGF